VHVIGHEAVRKKCKAVGGKDVAQRIQHPADLEVFLERGTPLCSADCQEIPLVPLVDEALRTPGPLAEHAR
jgi:hypothetical protein